MNDKKKLTLKILYSFRDLVIDMSDDELDKFLSDDYAISVKLTKIKTEKKLDPTSNPLETSMPINNIVDIFDTVLRELEDVKTRDEGLNILNLNFKTKTELEKFAKHIDVGVLKIDKIDKIKDNIIESTVGARLRSVAIQGKTQP